MSAAVWGQTVRPSVSAAVGGQTVRPDMSAAVYCQCFRPASLKPPFCSVCIYCLLLFIRMKNLKGVGGLWDDYVKMGFHSCKQIQQLHHCQQPAALHIIIWKQNSQISHVNVWTALTHNTTSTRDMLGVFMTDSLWLLLIFMLGVGGRYYCTVQFDWKQDLVQDYLASFNASMNFFEFFWLFSPTYS